MGVLFYYFFIEGLILRALLNTMRFALSVLTLTSVIYSCTASATTVVDVSGVDLYGNSMAGSFTYGDILDVNGNYCLSSAELTYAGKFFDTISFVNLINTNYSYSVIGSTKSGYIFSLIDSSSNALTFRAYLDSSAGVVDTSKWSSEDQGSFVSIYNTKASERVFAAAQETDTYVMLFAGLGLVSFAGQRIRKEVA
jgi:hypothetical protein